MAGKKGMKHYPLKIKVEVIEQYKNGKSIRTLSREYGISRYAIQSWRGLVSNTEQTPPCKRGRPRKTPLIPRQELEQENRQLRMEVELLRSFLQAAGRR